VVTTTTAATPGTDARRYAEIHAAYRDLYPALRPLFPTLARIADPDGADGSAAGG
jgi:hypothetical protein